MDVVKRLAWPAAVLALALALRLPALEHPSLWFDEAYSYCLAHEAPAAIVRDVRADAHPPLYFLLLHGWLGARGGVAWARALSVLCDLGTIALMMAPAGRFAGVLLALASTMVVQARQVRMYALLTFVVMLALVALVRAIERGGAGRWFAFACAALAAALCHHAGAVAMVALATLVPLEIAARRGGDARALASRFALAAGAAGAAYAALWLEAAVYQLSSTPLAARREVSLTGIFVDLTAGTLPAWPGARAACVLAFGVPLVLSARAVQARRAPWLAAQLWTFVLAGLVLTPVAPGGVFANRTLFYLQPAVLALVAHGIGEAGRGKVAAGAACVALLAGSCVNALTAPAPPYDWEAAARTLAKEAGPGALVVVHNPNSRLLLEAYLTLAWGNDAELTTIPYVAAGERFAGLGVDAWRAPLRADYDRVERRLRESGRTRFFLVLSSPESAGAVAVRRACEARWGPAQAVGEANSPSVLKVRYNARP